MPNQRKAIRRATKATHAKNLPDVRSASAQKVIAILVSDVHLSLRAPLARRAEPDWFAAMKRSLEELGNLAADYNAEVFYAGDIFDKWNSPPELINFALQYLPEGYAVPGQHDLPQHRIEDVEKSAYWTLVHGGTLESLTGSNMVHPVHDDLTVMGFPWGAELEEAPRLQNDKGRYIAVVHHYCGMEGFEHPGALATDRVGPLSRKLKGFNAAVFGDNHKGFIANHKKPYPNICNTGTFFCRHADERNYLPFVGLLYSDNSIRTHHLDTSHDKWVDDLTPDKEQMVSSFTDFMQELGQLEDEGMDFATAVRRASKGMSSMGRQMLLSALENAMETSK